MGFTAKKVNGIAKYLVDTDIDPQQLRMHISKVPAGGRSHLPHEHAGVEAFYMLEGHGTIEVEGNEYSLGPNEIILLDATKPHGLRNAGTVPMRYLVIIAGH
jgi:mannose-6-phosphate isomerase-like protein (cupin superfamily)